MDTHILNEPKRRFEPSYSKCCFCLKGQSTSMNDNCFRPVYREKNRTNLLVYRNVNFSEVKIGMPRCQHCRSTHLNVKIFSNIVLVIGILLIFIVPIVLSVKFDFGTLGMLVMMGMMFGLVVLAMNLVERFLLNRNDVTAELDNDVAIRVLLIQDFVRNGWTLKKPMA